MANEALPRASVIILGYNGRRYLEDCLSTALDQDLPVGSFEVIYTDNASSDDSVEYVKANFPEVRVLEFDRNWGFAAGNNRAVPEARGEWVVFLNQDTVCTRTWLRELLDGLDSTPGAMAGHANIIHPWYPDFGGLGERGASRNAYTPDLARWGYLRYRNLGPATEPIDVFILSGAALALKRAVISDLGYVFDERFWAYAEDWDLGFRLQAMGHRCLLVPSATVYHLYTARTGLRWASWVGTMRNLRNRYIAFYKASTWGEYVTIAALLTVGSPLNAFEFGLKLHQKVFFAVALVPTTLVAGIAALTALGRFSGDRKEILRKRAPGFAGMLSRMRRGRPAASR